MHWLWWLLKKSRRLWPLKLPPSEPVDDWRVDSRRSSSFEKMLNTNCLTDCKFAKVECTGSRKTESQLSWATEVMRTKCGVSFSVCGRERNCSIESRSGRLKLKSKTYVSSSNDLAIGKMINIWIDQEFWLTRPRNLWMSAGSTSKLGIFTSFIGGRRSKNPSSTVRAGLEESVCRTCQLMSWKVLTILTASEDWLISSQCYWPKQASTDQNPHHSLWENVGFLME